MERDRDFVFIFLGFKRSKIGIDPNSFYAQEYFSFFTIFGSMNKIRAIAVYCGSSKGFDPKFEESAHEMGRLIAEQGISLVFGGGHVGLMGAAANGALEAGGEVIGVIPKFLEDKELGHSGITKLITVQNMHERKAKIEELSDAFIALPGGIGTLEEISEMMTWGQLGLHNKPLGLLNTNHFYKHLNALLKEMVNSGFLRESQLTQLISEEDPKTLLTKIETARTSYTPKWIK